MKLSKDTEKSKKNNNYKKYDYFYNKKIWKCNFNEKIIILKKWMVRKFPYELYIIENFFEEIDSFGLVLDIRLKDIKRMFDNMVIAIKKHVSLSLELYGIDTQMLYILGLHPTCRWIEKIKERNKCLDKNKRSQDMKQLTRDGNDKWAAICADIWKLDTVKTVKLLSYLKNEVMEDVIFENITKENTMVEKILLKYFNDIRVVIMTCYSKRLFMSKKKQENSKKKI